MSKNVTFALPNATGLASRHLKIYRRREQVTSTVDLLSAVVASSDQVLAGTATHSTVSLAANLLWEATLVDTRSDGTVGPMEVISFNTGDGQRFPGAKSMGGLQVYAMVTA